MRRDLTRLCSEPHDLIVVGGGIHGACVAWEAARRGLKVALIEAGDFGQGTSSNSLRTLHGGLRHLQRLDFVHMRESIRERREWLRLAPELARPLRFVLPMSGDGIKSPLILRTALWINDLLSADRRIAAGAILDHDRLAPTLRQLLAVETRHQVGRPTRRERHDELHRPRRERIRSGLCCAAAMRQGQNERDQRRGNHATSHHDSLEFLNACGCVYTVAKHSTRELWTKMHERR